MTKTRALESLFPTDEFIMEEDYQLLLKLRSTIEPIILKILELAESKELSFEEKHWIIRLLKNYLEKTQKDLDFDELIETLDSIIDPK